MTNCIKKNKTNVSYSPYDAVVRGTMAGEARAEHVRARGRMPCRRSRRRCAPPAPAVRLSRTRSAGYRILFMHLNISFCETLLYK